MKTWSGTSGLNPNMSKGELIKYTANDSLRRPWVRAWTQNTWCKWTPQATLSMMHERSMCSQRTVPQMLYKMSPNKGEGRLVVHTAIGKQGGPSYHLAEQPIPKTTHNKRWSLLSQRMVGSWLLATEQDPRCPVVIQPSPAEVSQKGLLWGLGAAGKVVCFPLTSTAAPCSQLEFSGVKQMLVQTLHYKWENWVSEEGMRTRGCCWEWKEIVSGIRSSYSSSGEGMCLGLQATRRREYSVSVPSEEHLGFSARGETFS